MKKNKDYRSQDNKGFGFEQNENIHFFVILSTCNANSAQYDPIGREWEQRIGKQTLKVPKT